MALAFQPVVILGHNFKMMMTVAAQELNELLQYFQDVWLTRVPLQRWNVLFNCAAPPRKFVVFLKLLER